MAKVDKRTLADSVANSRTYELPLVVRLARLLEGMMEDSLKEIKHGKGR
jgi:hypothetical protein